MFHRKNPSPQPPQELTNKLQLIGSIKNALPFNHRGWINEAGLYVQLHFAGPLGRLEAGDHKTKSSISVWYRRSGEHWEIEKIDKYSPGEWEKLVQPTLEIAAWILSYGGLYEGMHKRLTEAVRKFRSAGTWVLLTEEESERVQQLFSSIA